jgi:hypothetical protein
MSINESAVLTLLGFFGIAIAVIVFLGVLSWILSAIGRWKVFVKAGEEGWKAIIPFYSDYILYRVSWKANFFFIALVLRLAGGYLSNTENNGGESMFLALLSALVGIASIVLRIALDIHIADRFGKGIGFVIGLFLLEPVFMLILGFGESRYLGNPDENIPPQDPGDVFGGGL